MSKKNSLTGIRDLDREIVNKLNDKDLLNMCGLNRTYSEKICNDDYFRIRTENGFSETVPYKDILEITSTKTSISTKTWKNHYFTMLKYIDLLKKELGYVYNSEYQSPELLYLSRKPIKTSKTFYYTKEEALMNAIRTGNLTIVKYLLESGDHNNYYNMNALSLAIEYGQCQIVKYIIHKSDDLCNYGLIYACEKGKLKLVKFLVENGADITYQNNEAIRRANNNRHISVIKYLTKYLSKKSKNNKNSE